MSGIDKARIRAAEKLWNLLHDQFVNIQEVMVQIISTRAWEPLGYSTFTEAFTERLSGVTLASELRPHVVYQMLDEGLTADEIAEQVKGVGPEGVEAAARQKRNGVPADAATVKAHPRLTRPHTLHMYVGAEEMESFHAIADKHGLSVLAIALDAVEKRFKELNDQDS